MSSIFRKDDNYVEEPKRNSYDMSFQNNITLNFGSLRPCLCLPVSPGDSLSIKPTFGLRFLPMKFPVQTRMKASIHYFYVRNRNLWKDFPDFIARTKQGLVPPYIHLTEQNRKQIETCQLGDFLGIPTRVTGKVYQGFNDSLKSHAISFASPLGFQVSQNQSQFLSYNPTSPNGEWYNQTVGKSFSSMQFGTSSTVSDSACPVFSAFIPTDQVSELDEYKVELSFTDLPNGPYTARPLLFDCNGNCVWQGENFEVPSSVELPLTMEFDIQFQKSWFESSTFTNKSCVFLLVPSGQRQNQVAPAPTLKIGRLISETFDTAEVDLSMLPWRSDKNQNGIPLSALPFRAYESIYNSFYRNAENNPFLIDGVPEYNRWCRTQDGGADTNLYPIMYHNWEDDFLTTAVPSPQQGNAPLVGLQGTPTLTIGHDDGSTTTAQLSVDEDGKVTAVQPLQGDEPTTAALIDAVSYGISINDFRNVNSFQRWLENNIRRGYKYRDQIKTHYGVTVRYDELDMPEFIGGTSEPVLVNQISQTVPTESSPLGDMAGQAGVVGSGQNITHYFDEHGFVIGIICIKPVANYSQLLPKHFNVTDAFDYYFPEFGHIGMQPITYAEVTPLQAYQEGKLNDVFGYQRAWYDLISKTDEVHGLFRTNLRNFLINRTFDGTPELGAEFTVMDPEQINDVFAYTENTDKILGQIYMDIKKKTPIPLYGIPKLE